MRKIAIAVGVVLVVLVVGSIFFLSNLNSVAAKAIEKVGSRVAGVPVSVKAVDISLTSGIGIIRGLSIGNPAGFQSAHCLTLDEVTLQIDISSITKNPVVIKDVTAIAPEVAYDVNTDGGSNLSALQKNIKTFAASQDKTASDGKAGGDKANGQGGRKLVIEHLALKDVKLDFATPLPGGATNASLGDITLTNIGKSEGGASSAEVASAILGSLSKTAIAKASSLGVGKVLDSVSSTTSGGLDQVKGLLGK